MTDPVTIWSDDVSSLTLATDDQGNAVLTASEPNGVTAIVLRPDAFTPLSANMFALTVQRAMEDVFNRLTVVAEAQNVAPPPA